MKLPTTDLPSSIVREAGIVIALPAEKSPVCSASRFASISQTSFTANVALRHCEDADREERGQCDEYAGNHHSFGSPSEQSKADQT